jgi:hypothetical protein
MPNLRPFAPAILALLALTGCKGEEKPVAAASGTAGGEILDRSVSDAMLPLDQVRSQPPLAPKSEVSAGAAAGSDKPDSHPKAAHAAKPKVNPAEPAPEPAAADTATGN